VPRPKSYALNFAWNKRTRKSTKWSNLFRRKVIYKLDIISFRRQQTTYTAKKKSIKCFEFSLSSLMGRYRPKFTHKVVEKLGLVQARVTRLGEFSPNFAQWVNAPLGSFLKYRSSPHFWVTISHC
jgi:hypothetical protein